MVPMRMSASQLAEAQEGRRGIGRRGGDRPGRWCAWRRPVPAGPDPAERASPRADPGRSDPATTVAAATSPVCSAADTTAAARSSAALGESPAPMVSARSWTNAGLRATYPSPSREEQARSRTSRPQTLRPGDRRQRARRADRRVSAMGASSAGRPMASVDPSTSRSPAPCSHASNRSRIGGDRVAPLLQPGDPLEPPHVGLVVEPDPTDPGRGMQDLPRLVLPDRAHRSARPRRELLDPEACLRFVISLRVSHPSTLPANTVTVNTVTNANATDTSTTGQLLDTLRQVTGRPGPGLRRAAVAARRWVLRRDGPPPPRPPARRARP